MIAYKRDIQVVRPIVKNESECQVRATFKESAAELAYAETTMNVRFAKSLR